MATPEQSTPKMKHAHGEISEAERAARWTIKLKAIFESVGLTAEGIAAVSKGVSVPARRPVEPTKVRPRPSCLYCGKRIGYCHPGRRPATGAGAWP